MSMSGTAAAFAVNSVADLLIHDHAVPVTPTAGAVTDRPDQRRPDPKDHPLVGGSGALLRITGRLGRRVEAVALVGNVGAYLGSLALLDATRAAHPPDLKDWQSALTVLLISFQALWMHWLRTQPLGTLIASLGLWSGGLLLTGPDPLTVQPGIMLVCFAFAAERTGWWRVWVLSTVVVAGMGAFTAAEALHPVAGSPPWHTPGMVAMSVLTAIAVVAGPALAGAWYAQLRDRSERIAALAREIASRESVRTAEAVAAARRTIAQELHDTSSAHLAAILTLGTATEVGATSGKDTSALVAQMREEAQMLYQGFERMVARMRQDDRTQSAAPHATAPGQHSVVDLPLLIDDHLQSTGIAPTLRHDPDLHEIAQRLGPMRSHIAYRVAQEALSNARKHAAGAAITLVVEDDGSSLLIRIENDLPSDGGASLGNATTLSLGYGIDGMRDRLSTVGGSLRTGPRQAGGWAVQALIPHPPHRTVGTAP